MYLALKKIKLVRALCFIEGYLNCSLKSQKYTYSSKLVLIFLRTVVIYIRISSLTVSEPWLDIKNNLENRRLFGDIPNNHTTPV
jgi:hypothetical protein